MVWGWHYDDGLGDYTYALLERTGDADRFGAWHKRESLRRELLLKRIELNDLSPEHIADLSLGREAGDVGKLSAAASLEEQVAWHLAENLLPAVPPSVASVCAQAVRAARLGFQTVQIELPASVWFTPGDGRTMRSASVAEIVRQHGLSRFILRDTELRRAVDRRWGLEDALEAWWLASEGKWELPSPIPSWPEFVTLLLVGRNFLESGEDDDPSEPDQIRSWWGPGGWRRGFNAGWWDAQTVRLMSLPDASNVGVQPVKEEDVAGDVSAIHDWLATISEGTVKDGTAFLPHGWKKLIEAIWRPDDLTWTEDLIRRSIGQEFFPGKHPTGVADLNALLARVLLAQGKDERALEALKPLKAIVWGPVLPGLPYWWFQMRALAEGRVALEEGEYREAFKCFLDVVQSPHPGRYADPDYLLQGLYELAALDPTDLPEAPPRSEWARRALAAAHGFAQWSETRGWSRPDGYDAETTGLLNLIRASRTVQWQSVTGQPPPIGLNGITWSDESDYLSEMLDELVTTYAYNRFVEPRPFIKKLGKLWDPEDLTRTRLRVTERLIDAYDHRDAAPSDDLKGNPEPWHRHPMAVLQLEALLARALATQEDPTGARLAAARAFGPHASPPGWVAQLEALTAGRLSSCLGDTETAFDSYWLAVRLWMAGAETDLDLLLETFCELAMLGHISPRHADPNQWAEVVAVMTRDRPDDEWQPGSWYESQFRAAIEGIQRPGSGRRMNGVRESL